MSSASRSHDDPTSTTAHEKGQRLYCETCGSEIEVISPCTCVPPGQVLQCCGEPMKPTIGHSINLGDE